MAKVSLYIAASLDGYIARRDGGIDWLSLVERQGEDYGYNAFYTSMDAIVMGRKTYELGLSFGEWPYPGKKSFVFTRRDLKSSRDGVAFVSGEPDRVLKNIQAHGFEKIWLVGGGELTGAFLQQGLIDEYIVSIIPTILGEDVPLFPPLGREEKLALINAATYASGLVQLHYRRQEKV